MMNLNALKIDPEFQGKIPPLTFEELNQLEANILRDGRIINPIIVWQGLIVDGHNRYTIAKKHPEIPFTVHEKSPSTRKSLQAAMKPSSGSAKTSWGGVTSLRNRRSTLSENSTRLRNAPMAVTEKVLLQNQVTESVT